MNTSTARPRARRSLRWAALTLAVVFFLSFLALRSFGGPPQNPRFINIASPEMADPRSNTRGACWADVDRDGDQDLFVAATFGTSHLWRNDGGSVFVDVIAWLGAKVVRPGGCAFVDIDSDGDPDLFVTANARDPQGENMLFRNRGDGRFDPVKLGAPLTMPEAGAAAIDLSDFDLDGDLDAFIAVRLGPREVRFNRLLEQVAPWKFVDRGSQYAVARPPGPGWTFLGSWFDFDADGDDDLLIAIDFWGVELYRNDRGQFKRVTLEALPPAQDKTPGAPPNNPMGVTWGDYDGDGCSDVFITGTNMLGQGGFEAETLGDLASRLYRNRCDGTLEDVTRAAGLRPTGVVEWSANFVDFDNDGDLDLAVVAGNAGERTTTRSTFGKRFATRVLTMIRRRIPARVAAWAYRYEAMVPATGGTGLAAAMPNYLYQNMLVETDRPVFRDVTHRAGVSDLGSTQGSAWADVDNDGDLDWFVPNRETPSRLYRNDGPVGGYLRVHLEGARDAIGSWVKIKSGGRTQLRHVHVLDGYLSQSQMDPHFGLGTAQTVDEIFVRWTGTTTWVRACAGVPANRMVTITQTGSCRW